MTTKTRIIAVVVVAVILAVAFGYHSFQNELASIRSRQHPGAVVCRDSLNEARALVEAAKAAEEEGDVCRAESTAAQAVEQMARTQRDCRPHVERDPMVATDAAIARMDERRAQLHEQCLARKASQSP